MADVAVNQESEGLVNGVLNLSVTSPPVRKDDSDKPTSKAEASLLTKVLWTKLIPNQHDVEVIQSDPTHPLHSVKSFKELCLKPSLLKGVYGMQFNHPSKIQQKALPILLANPSRNLIAQSQSGTGKTVAFVLAMLSRVNPSK